MLYHRTASGAHRLPVRLLAGVALVALVVLGFLGNPPQLRAQVKWQDPVSLPPISGTSATGRSAPVPLNAEIDGTFPVSITTQPTLVWKNVPAGTAQATFKVVTLDSTNPKTLWSTTATVAADRTVRARLSPGILQQGRTYAWTATSVEAPSNNVGPYSLTVDMQRASVQPIWSFGDASVAEGTGELVYQYQGPTVNALSGPVGWTLTHRGTNTTRVGLPAGWNLSISGTSGWETLRQNADGSVTLLNNGGGAVSYTKSGANQWKPAVGRYASAGQGTLLAQNADGTFSATDGNRTVTVFSKPTVNADGHPTKVWNLDAPTIQQTWSGGLLTTLVDPVTQSATVFLYGGATGCSPKTDPGFIAAPQGMLCAVLDWAGNMTAIEYVKTPAGAQIGRIVAGLGQGMDAGVTDLGWDASGRIVESRAPFATRVVAAGAVSGLGAEDKRVFTQVAYDAQGRVATITAPEGLTQSGSVVTRGTATLSYAPFTATFAGTGANAGVIHQTWLDPLTLEKTKERDNLGNIVEYAYNPDGTLLRTTDRQSGTVTENRYDAQGRTTDQLGPTRDAVTSPTAPHTSTAYDQDINGNPWTGLAARYWGNAGFNGAPSGGTTGPIMPGTTGPVTGLSMNWAASPVGTGAWSARLTGLYSAPADGTYAFRNTTAARIWVNSALCSPTCSVTLRKDATAAIQIDVVASDGGAAGVNALVTTPTGTTTPIPTSALRPNYGLATSTTVREHQTGGGTTNLTSKFVYDPITTQLLKTISPSGATESRTYEPYNPANGQWGRSTSVTDASGKTTTSSFYAANEVATDCAGNVYSQEAQPQATTLAGGRVVSQVNAPDGGGLKISDGTSTTCGSMLANGLGTASTTTGLGPDVTNTSSNYVNGNPLVISTSTTSQGKTETTIDHLDTNGNAWEDIDAFGTRTISTIDPVTGNVTRLTETTAKGETRTIDYTYASNGQVATVTANGRLLLTNEYSANGGFVRTVLANGAVQTVELDANNFGKKVATTFADGTTTTETAVHSPSGRLLSRTLTGPGGTATYTYQYNVDGRLVDTTLTGTIPTTSTAWRSTYTGAEGAGGNRASKTTTLADGTTETTDFTYGADNRLLTASAGRIKGAIQYDAAGRATQIGGVSLAYDAAGHLLSASETGRSYTFTDGGLTSTFTRSLADGTTSTVSVSSSGQSLQLGPDKAIEAQVVGLTEGISVILDKSGAPARWIYDDMLGSMAWRSAGTAAPNRTHLYSPGGEPISATRGTTPATPVDLLVNSIGWMDGRGATTLRLSVPLMIIGAREYTPDGGRWLEADSSITASMNAYEYATGDPINQADPSGNASMGWLWGAIASVVVGAAIGAFTFGIGPAITASYGFGALAAQLAIGAVGGAIAGAVGEVVTQGVDNGWSAINWSSVGIAAGIGAGTSALFTGAAAFGTKIWFTKSVARQFMANTPAEYATLKVSYSAAFAQMRAVRTAAQKARGEKIGFFRDMFTSKGLWNPRMRAALQNKGRGGVNKKLVYTEGGGMREASASVNPFDELGLGGSGSIRASNGLIASGESQGARLTANISEEIRPPYTQQIIKNDPNYSPPVARNSYGELRTVSENLMIDDYVKLFANNPGGAFGGVSNADSLGLYGNLVLQQNKSFLRQLSSSSSAG